MLFDHLVLAGGGHTHSLMLLRWAKYPHQRPKGLITLINRNSTTIYSAMIPGVISGEYRLEDAEINLRKLAEMAGVSFVRAEIKSLNAAEKTLFLDGRPNINFSRISLDVGSETKVLKGNFLAQGNDLVFPIKPFANAVKWIEDQDHQALRTNAKSFTIVGAGLAGIEIAFALRKRWPNRPLNLQVSSNLPRRKLIKSLSLAKIHLIEGEALVSGPRLLCIGSQPAEWLGDSDLDVDVEGRVLTLPTLQSKKYSYVFAVGDCGVIEGMFRPASGVWAVRAAKPLAINIARQEFGLQLIPWKPQKKALQLIGGPFESEKSFGWAFWGGSMFGPYPWLWTLKQSIDQRFIQMFLEDSSMRTSLSMDVACRGCAAKLPAQPLQRALKKSGLSGIANSPEDAVFINTTSLGSSLVQSVDGFPSLISDPWLNARLTTLHACSDIWATGAAVVSVQPIITLPAVSDLLQSELLVQILGGIKSVLEPQKAKIIGGHTIESRYSPPHIVSSGIDITLCVNGSIPQHRSQWKKKGLESNDVLLISRALGTGVLFAAAMKGKGNIHDLDFAIQQMNLSQHVLIDSLLIKQDEGPGINLVHACTDITGFGLLGHLSEMLHSSNSERLKTGLKLLKIRLDVGKIPIYPGVLDLFDQGYASTLAPANRNYWNLINADVGAMSTFELDFGRVPMGSDYYQQIMELIVDPQTCGPLVLACTPALGEELVDNGGWIRFGSVQTV